VKSLTLFFSYVRYSHLRELVLIQAGYKYARQPKYHAADQHDAPPRHIMTPKQPVLLWHLFRERQLGKQQVSNFSVCLNPVVDWTNDLSHSERTLYIPQVQRGDPI